MENDDNVGRALESLQIAGLEVRSVATVLGVDEDSQAERTGSLDIADGVGHVLGHVLDPARIEAALAGHPGLALAGAACPPDVKHRLIELFPAGSTWEFYGSTEGQFTACRSEEWLERPGTVGRAPGGAGRRSLRADLAAHGFQVGLVDLDGADRGTRVFRGVERLDERFGAREAGLELERDRDHRLGGGAAAVEEDEQVIRPAFCGGPEAKNAAGRHCPDC